MYTGGTTNLRLKHNTGIEHENTPQKQPSMAEFVRSPRSRHLSGTKAEEITRAIVNMVVQDYMPLRIVEGSGFKNLMSLKAPSLVSDMLLFSTVFIKTFTQINLKPHEFIRKTMDKISCLALGPMHCTQVWKNVY